MLRSSVEAAKRAVAITYLHLLAIDGPTLKALAEDFPASRRSLRLWTLYNGLKEYMLELLRHASDEERQAAHGVA